MIIFRTFLPPKLKIPFFSSAHGLFSATDHILGHKTKLNNFKSISIISRIFSDHNRMKQGINHMSRNKGKKMISCRLNNTLLKKQWVNNETKQEI